MILEIHVIQNIAPSNLNRDDTGAPKDTVFGGYRRARVSSQSWKRAIRKAFRQQNLIPADQLGDRTKRLIRLIDQGLADLGHTPEDTLKVSEALLAGLALERDEDSPITQPDTEYLILLSKKETEGLINLANDNWDELLELASQKSRLTKKTGPKAISAEIRKQGMDVLDGGNAVDTALFGRMLADLPSANIEASTQVAHAISTHAVEMEFDFFTAVDDLKEEERLSNPARSIDAGAEMMGTVEFNSSTYYRYTNVDIARLLNNLDHETETAERAIRAYAEAFVTSIPTGKQNSFAGQNLPSFAFAVVRHAGRWSLANAFVEPVRKGENGLVGESILALEDYWKRITEQYGDKDILALPVCIDSKYSFGAGQTSENLADWIDTIVNAINVSGR